MKKLLIAALAWIGVSLAGPALAQSNCSYIATGAVLTAAQWNQCFAQKQNTLGYVPVNRAGDVMLGKFTTQASQVSGGGFNIPQGNAPAAPINGDIWTTLTGVFARINGVTVGPFGAISSSSFAATAPLGVTFPAGVVTYALAYDANFTVNGSNQLALANIASGSLIANCGASPAEPSGCAWTAFADRAISSSNGSFPYRTGGVWSTISSGTTGGTVPLNNTANVFSAIQSVNLNTGLAPSALTGALLNLTAADATTGRVQINAYGAITAFTGAVFGGTNSSPTAVTSGTQLTGVNAHAYNGTSLVGPIVSFRTYAAENISSGHQGSKACMATTPIASTTLADVICAENDAGVTVGAPTGGSKGAGTLNATALYVNGTAVTGAGITALTGDVTATGPGSVAATIANNAVTNAKSAQMLAATLKGNPTASTANASDFTIQGLTSLGSPDATLDFLPIYDHVAGTIKRVTPSAIAGSVVAGVASINGNTGVFTTSSGIATVVNDIRLATIAADNVLMNSTGSTAVPIATAVPNCTGAAKGLTYDTSAHTFGCTTNTTGTVTSVSVTAGTGITQSGSPVTGSGSITVNVDKATAANYYAAASNKVVTTDIIYPAEVTVTFGSTTTFDFSTFNNAIVTLTANITTQTLSNVTAGKAGTIRFQQSGAGSFTTVWNSIFKFPGGTTPTLTTGSATAVDVLNYFCVTAVNCPASLMKDVK